MYCSVPATPVKSSLRSLRSPVTNSSMETRPVVWLEPADVAVAMKSSPWDEPAILTPRSKFAPFGPIAKSLCPREPFAPQKPLQAYNVRRSTPVRWDQRKALEFLMKLRALAIANAILLSVCLALPVVAQDNSQSQTPSPQATGNSPDQNQPSPTQSSTPPADAAASTATPADAPGATHDKSKNDIDDIGNRNVGK